MDETYASEYTLIMIEMKEEAKMSEATFKAAKDLKAGDFLIEKTDGALVAVERVHEHQDAKGKFVVVHFKQTGFEFLRPSFYPVDLKLAVIVEEL